MAMAHSHAGHHVHAPHGAHSGHSEHGVHSGHQAHEAAPGDRARQRRALTIALVANGVFVAVEVAGGIAFRSLALLADAAHMLSDVVALGIALFAQSLLTRPASGRLTFGLQRAEVLGAQANAVILLATSVWIFVEAFRRLGEPADVQGVGMLVVAVVGLAVNLGSALLLARVPGGNLNLRAAMTHLLTDAAGSVAAIIAALAVVALAATWVDPVVSVLIGALVLWSAWGILRDATHVLLEGTPRGMDPADVERTLMAVDGVEAVHHLHLWNLASDTPALSAHVVLGEQVSLHEAQAKGQHLKDLLARHHGIDHATVELECHQCTPTPLC